MGAAKVVALFVKSLLIRTPTVIEIHVAGGKWVSVDISQGPETQDEEPEHPEGGAAHEAT